MGMFKRISLGVLLTLVLNSHVNAGVVTVWGEEVNPGPKALINNFYNSLPGNSSSLATGDLTTVDLTATNLLWATQPADDYTPAELAKMASFVASGGRIAFMGEHGLYSPSQNLRINAALAFLGSGISINNVALDAGTRTASVADSQILAHPLLTGVLTYQYACFAPLTISGGAQALMLGQEPYLSNPSVMMGYQNIGPGSVFVITDQNVWDDEANGWPGYGNPKLFQNLLNGNTAVDAPSTNPVIVTNLTSSTPTISWTYSDLQGDIQQKYEVEVWTGPFGTGTRVWDPPFGTGTATSVVYAGAALTPSVTYYARVRASDAGWGNFSEVAFALIGTNTAPTTNPVTISDPANATPTIGWTYHDAENNPQAQYEVEVRTGPNGTGASIWHPAVASGTATNILYSGAALVNGQTYYARVRAYDGAAWGAWSEASWVVALNHAPIAKAGRDSTLYAGTSCRATFTLDGSASSDPDGDPITYAWSGPFSGTLAGVSPTVSLALGTQSISLAVTDSKAAIGRDTAVITVLDTLKPVPTLASLPDVVGSCSATLKSVFPTATDNCKATITATTADSLSFATQGTRTVHWIYTDDNGNTATQNQTVIVSDRVPPKIASGADTSITISVSTLSRKVALTPGSAIDSCSIATILGTRDDGLSLDSAYRPGTTKVQWKACDNFGNCDSAIQNVTLVRNRPPVLVAYLDTAYKGKDFLRFLISATDSDGTIAAISAATELPPGGSFVDSGSGKASLLWPRDCNDHCLDRVTIRAYDGTDSASTQIIAPQVDKPTAIHSNATAFADSTLFPDSICVQFTTATDSAALRYVLSGAGRDTSSFLIGARQNLCVDRNVTVTVIAIRPGWINSLPLSLHLLKMDTAEAAQANPGDSTYFLKSLCITLTSPTQGSQINLTLRGRFTDSTAIVKPNGDSVCIEDTTTILAITRKAGMIQSPQRSFSYIRMRQLGKPQADKPDTSWFSDSICIRFTLANPGAVLHYTVDGGKADSSSPILREGQALCRDRSTEIRAIATEKNWIASDEIRLRVLEMDTVARTISDRSDSTYFKDSLCVNLSTSTERAEIRYTLDGGRPDTAQTMLPQSGRLCAEKTVTIRAVGMREHWINSPEVSWTYLRMQRAAKPVFDHQDTVFYPFLCTRISSGTEGADLHYTLDGGNPDTSSLVKQVGDTVCVDANTDIKVIAKKKNWIDSDPASLQLVKMAQVAAIRSSLGDTVLYAHRICFTLSSATDSARIAYSLDGGDPLASGISIRNGDSVCLERSAELVAMGTKDLWRNSLPSRFVFEVDNQGPDVKAAVKHPFSLGSLSVSGNCRGIGQDTLVLTLSEKLTATSHPPQWDHLAVFSPRCDRSSLLPIPMEGEPVFSSDSLTLRMIVNNNSGIDAPMLGNCIYLDSSSGAFVDRVGNPPDVVGAKLVGTERTAHISQIRAYPPVVGLDNATPSKGCLDEGAGDNSWIPPYGFDPATGLVDGSAAQSCSQGNVENETQRTSIPSCMSILEVVSDGAYQADIGIFDQLGNMVQSSHQQFGSCGELENLNRRVAGKNRSFLVWNARDGKGDRVGTGAYIWRINFRSVKNGRNSSQAVFVRTGFIRTSTCSP